MASARPSPESAAGWQASPALPEAPPIRALTPGLPARRLGSRLARAPKRTNHGVARQRHPGCRQAAKAGHSMAMHCRLELGVEGSKNRPFDEEETMALLRRATG